MDLYVTFCVQACSNVISLVRTNEDETGEAVMDCIEVSAQRDNPHDDWMDRVSCSVHFAPINIMNMRRRNAMLVFYFLQYCHTCLCVQENTLAAAGERCLSLSESTDAVEKLTGNKRRFQLQNETGKPLAYSDVSIYLVILKKMQWSNAV